MKEQWKPIDGTDGRYDVSNTGRVRNNNNYRNTNTAKVISQRLTQSGRVLVTLYIEGKRKDFQAHRLVAKAFIPNDENLPQVNHIDGNPQNNSVENLEWCDAFHNMRHAYRTGLMENAREAAKVTVRNLVEISKTKMIPITAVNMETAEYQKFDGINVAAISLGIGCPEVLEVLKGRSHTTKGYTFIYGHDIDAIGAAELVERVNAAIAQGYDKQTRSIIEQRGRAVVAIDSHGVETRYETIIEASRETGVARSSIRKVAGGTQKKAKGYRFMYAEGEVVK